MPASAPALHAIPPTSLLLCRPSGVRARSAPCAGLCVLRRSSSEHETVCKKARILVVFAELVGATENGPLDCAQVTDQFSGRPSALRGPRFPLFGRDGIRGTQKFALRARQILDDGRK